MIKRIPHTVYFYSAYLLIAVMALWQIVFMVHPVIYDMPDCYFPWRYMVTGIVNTGELPLWNPYQLFGSPIHADPSSGAWYPPVWIIGFFAGYDVHVLGLELTFHTWIAGIGFYKLARFFNYSTRTAFILGMAYMLSGLFIGNAQHLTYIVSGCWIPFILRYFLLLNRELKMQYAAKAALAMFMIITGGYPAFYIILSYVLLAILVYSIGNRILKGRYIEALKTIGLNVLFGIFTLAATAVMLVSVYGALSYITRANSFKLENALYGPFSLPSMISFFLPFGTLEQEFVKTDISMANAYFTGILFLFFLFSIPKIKEPLLRVFLGVGIVALCAGLGDILPVRGFMFNHLPLMNLFRFPSVFRIFVIIAFLLVSGITLENILQQSLKRKWALILLFVSTILAIAGISIYLFAKNPFDIGLFWKEKAFSFQEQKNTIQHVIFQSIPAVISLLLATLIIQFIKSKKYIFFLLTGLLLTDLLFAFQLNAPYNAFYERFDVKSKLEMDAQFAKGFPLPDLSIPMENRANHLYNGLYWKNLNILSKQPSSDGMNNFMFSSTMNLLDNHPALFTLISKNGLAYLSDELHSYREFKGISDDSSFSAQHVFLRQNDMEGIEKNTLRKSAEDKLEITDFKPNRAVFKTQTSASTLFTLLQSNYEGWEVSLDGNKIPHYTSNTVFMSVLLPPGNHELVFNYSNKKVHTAFLISLISLLLMFAYILYIELKRFLPKLLFPPRKKQDEV